jgi:hypothetical protein
MLAVQQTPRLNNNNRPHLRIPRNDQRVSALVDQLLRDIYGDEHRRLSLTSPSLDSDTGTADWSCAESVSSVTSPRCKETLVASLKDKGKIFILLLITLMLK